METYGADIIRLWALSVDYTEDHRIGDEILKGVADQYRKLRNSFRYLLGALDGFTEAERVPVEQMPELERYVLALLARLDGKLRAIVSRTDADGNENPDWCNFNLYTRLLVDFCNEDLSAFFFDIRKDSLYCDAGDSPKRMAYRSVLDTLFHALIRYAAPVLVFTAEEVWGTRFPDAGSVHLLEWPVVDAAWWDEDLEIRWSLARRVRAMVTATIEPMRRDKIVGSSLEADIRAHLDLSLRTVRHWLSNDDTAELCIVSSFQFGEDMDHAGIQAEKTTHHKCGRCWRHLPEVSEDGALCGRCESVVTGLDAA